MAPASGQACHRWSRLGFAHLHVLVVLVVDHDLDQQVFGPDWNWFLAHILYQLAHLHAHSVGCLLRVSTMELDLFSERGGTED